MAEDYMVVRGERIIAQLNEVSTPTQLRRNIEIAFPNTKKRQHVAHSVQMHNIEYIPYIGVKMLHVRATARNDGHQYNVALQFNGVSFAQQDGPQVATLTATDGQEFSLTPVTMRGNYAKVRCSCMDFYFRFAFYNAGDKSLVGRPPKPYIRKTLDRPSVNPDQVPGLCKHAIKLIQDLERIGLVRR